jgi:eukaryotic-like serine/threonine-protein kinase
MDRGVSEGSALLGRPDAAAIVADEAAVAVFGDVASDLALHVLTPGTRVGRYEVVGVLGSGGMGVVYRAHDPDLSRDVALKLVHQQRKVSLVGNQYEARLLREARALARLSHPNVVAAYDVGTYGDAVFVAMERIAGVSLRSFLGQKPSYAEVLRVLIAAGRGLAAAHAAHVLHLDFKPSNVMVSPDGRTRVVDFGLAREARAERAKLDRALLPASDAFRSDAAQPSSLPSPSSGLSSAGSICGTLGYVAPEHLSGEAVDAAADQFSYAATAFTALAGYRPYAGETLAAYRATLLNRERAAWPRSVPGAVRRIIDRGLALRREDRYPSVAAMVDALERAASPKRTLARIGAPALALAAVASLFVASARLAGTSCQLDPTPFVGVWDSEGRNAVARAFRATGRPHAVEVFERVARRLDDFRSQWLTMKREACEATHVRAEQSEQALGLRSACLNRKLDGFGALVDVFSTIDATLLDHVGGATPGSLDECADVGALLGAAAKLPENPQRRAWIAGVESGYDITLALLSAGRWQAAVERAQSALGLALKADYGRAIALATSALGRAKRMAARNPEDRLQAETVLRESVRLAAEAGDDALLAQCASHLFMVVAQEGRIQEAEAMLPSAEALAIRAGNRSEQRIEISYGRARISIARRRFEKAIEMLREVERLASTTAGETSRRGIEAAGDIGHIYRELGRHDEAVAALTRVVEAQVEVYGARHPRVLLALLELAVGLAEMHRPAAALATLSQAKALAAELPPDEPSARHIPSVEGQIWEHRDDCVRAVPLYRVALAHYTRVDGEGHPLAGDAHARLGRCLAKTNALDEGVGELDRALAIRLETGAPSADTAQTTFELADALWSTPAQHARALNLAREALAVWRREAMPKRADEVQQWLDARRSTR